MFGLNAEQQDRVGTAGFEESLNDISAGGAGAFSERFEAAQLLLELMPAVESAISPLLSSHGLSASSCPDDVLAVEGLADELVTAALSVVRIRLGNNNPIQTGLSGSSQHWGEPPAGVLGFHVPSFGARDDLRSPSARSSDFVGGARQWGGLTRMSSTKGQKPDPNEPSIHSWGLGAVEGVLAQPLAMDCATRRSMGGMLQKYRYLKDPNRPRSISEKPPFAEPPSDNIISDCQEDTERDCTSSEKDEINSSIARLEELVDRIPTKFAHENYRAAFRERLNGVESKCNDCWDDMAFYERGPKNKNQIVYEKDFFRWTTSDTVGFSLAVSRLEIRASIVAHEMVHLLDHEDFEKNIYLGHASCERPGCNQSGEYRGAYIQAKVLNLSDCIAEAFGCGYMRSYDDANCRESSTSAAYYYLKSVLACNGISGFWITTWMVVLIGLILVDPVQGTLAALTHISAAATFLLLSLLVDVNT